MPKQIKNSSKVSERNTKTEILQAYQTLLEQATNEAAEDETIQQEQAVIDTAAKDTIEKITSDLAQARLSANQTISKLTEKLTDESERLTTLRKAITIAQRELEEIQQIKARAGMLRRMIELQKQEEERFDKEMAAKRIAWAEEQKQYEEQVGKERSREEDEYMYQKNLRMKRDRDLFEEERKKWEREFDEKKQVQIQKEAELAELRKKVLQFPQELDRAVKAAIAQTITQEKKEAQIRQNFAKQEADTRQQIATLKITSLENTVKSQAVEIEELKRQLEKATQQIKDIAVKVIEGVKKEPDQQLKAAPQTTS